ncbi:hypothetical protein GQ457_02G017230 [Hibiscus cannabinus]
MPTACTSASLEDQLYMAILRYAKITPKLIYANPPAKAHVLFNYKSPTPRIPNPCHSHIARGKQLASPPHVFKATCSNVFKLRSRVVSTERTILSPFTKEYRVLSTPSGICLFLEGCSSLNAPIPILVSWFLCLLDWVVRNLTQAKLFMGEHENWDILFDVIVWNIWLIGNAIIFDSIFELNGSVIERSRYLVDMSLAAVVGCRHRNQMSSAGRVSTGQWVLQEEGWIKLNSDRV